MSFGIRASLLHCSVTMVDKLVNLPKVTQGECYVPSGVKRISLVAQMVKHLPKMQETWVRSLGWEESLEKERLPTSVFWPGEFHGLYSPWGRRESNMTERLSVSLHSHPYMTTGKP